jgi:hypothetical protein
MTDSKTGTPECGPDFSLSADGLADCGNGFGEGWSVRKPEGIMIYGRNGTTLNGAPVEEKRPARTSPPWIDRIFS